MTKITYDQKQELYGIKPDPRRSGPKPILRAARFDSLATFTKTAASVQQSHDCFAYQSQDNGNPPTDLWDHSLGFNGALELTKTGWIDGARDVIHAAAKNSTKHGASDVTITPAPMGIYADVTAALQGDLEPFYDVDMVPEIKPSITLICGTSCCAHSSAEDVTRRGAGILTAIQALELSGIRVALFARSSGLDSTDNIYFYTFVRVKHADQGLNIPALAAVFCHSAFERRLGFAGIEMLAPKTFSMGYGSAMHDTPPETLAHCFRNAENVVTAPPFYRQQEMASVSAVAVAIIESVAAAKHIDRGLAEQLKNQITNNRSAGRPANRRAS